MKIIKPYFEIMSMTPSPLQLIELAYRNCYKSEDKLDPAKSGEFLRKYVGKKHETPIEHASATVRFIVDRGVSHELVRHRLASFCLAGDTKILRYAQNRGHLTIKELYERQQDGQLRGRNKLMLLRSMCKDGNILPNKFRQVVYSGKKEVYKVKTELGYSIKCSKDHVFFNDSGEVKLENLSVDDSVFVNGRPSTISITDDEIARLYNNVGMNPAEIAEHIKTKYRNVIYKLKELGIFVKRKNDKDKEKYFKNHTEDSRRKAGKTIKQQYENGRTVWNKGIKEHEHPSVKRQADSLRMNQYIPTWKGADNPSWKGDDIETDSGKRLRFSKYDKIECEMCGSKENLENHHRDGDIDNWHETNKQTLCIPCHKLIHKGYNVKKAVLDKIISIKYVGIEDTYDIEMEEPYHNFVANGFIVHNSQESTRYANYSKEKFGKEITVIEPCFFEPGSLAYDIWKTEMLSAESAYFRLLKNGATPEQARSVLPNSLKTDIVMTANIREWRHVFKLRCSKAAHPQMREIMLPLLAKFNEILPDLFFDIMEGLNK